MKQFFKKSSLLVLLMLVCGTVAMASGSRIPLASKLDTFLEYAIYIGGMVMAIGLVGTVLMLINGGGAGAAFKGAGIVAGGLLIANLDWLVSELGLGGVIF